MSSPWLFSYSRILSSVSWSSSFPWNMCEHRSSTVRLSISAASPSRLKFDSYSTTNSLMRLIRLASSICFLNFSLHKYDRVMRRCIRTLTSMGSRMNFKMLSMMCTVCSGLLARLIWHHLEWITLASMAVAKSKQNMWILMVNEVLTSLSTQLMISLSRQVPMMVSLTEHFWSTARQKRWVTLPWSCSYRTLITLWMMASLLLQVMYSMPLMVETTTLISEVMACLSDLFLMLRMWSRNLKFSYWLILKMSLRMSSQTRLFLSSGAIWRALTRRESRIQMMPQTLLSATCCSSLPLCSLITFSLMSSLPSTFPSLMMILWCFPSWILQFSMVSFRLSYLDPPSLMLWMICSKFMETEKICRPACNTYWYFFFCTLFSFYSCSSFFVLLPGHFIRPYSLVSAICLLFFFRELFS